MHVENWSVSRPYHVPITSHIAISHYTSKHSNSNEIQGHISRDCTAPNGGPLSAVGKVCYKCSQAGHISRDCPTNETKPQTTSDQPASANMPVTMSSTTDSAAVTSNSAVATSTTAAPVASTASTAGVEGSPDVVAAAAATAPAAPATLATAA